MKSIIELAREAGAYICTSSMVPDSIPEISFVPQKLEHFAHLVRAQALEEVDKKVPWGKHTNKWESCRIADYNQGWNDYRKQCAAAIRQLKDKT